MTVTPPPRVRRGVKLAEQLAQEIVADIKRWGMSRGDRFPSEVVMAHERGVSRTSLREALRILEVHGLITIKPGPGGGPELAELTSQDYARMSTLHFHRAGVTFQHLLEARLVLEPRLAQLAASNRTAEQVRLVRTNLRWHERAEDSESLVFYAHEFHSIVCNMASSGNAAIALMASSLHGIFDVYSRQSGDAEVMRRTVTVHRTIADAIEEGDAAAAGELMESHMRTSAATFWQENPTLIGSTVSWLSH